jgi:hypothetical protein
MPRRPRDDIYPIIRMRDTSLARKLARDALDDPSLEVVVYYRSRYRRRYQVLDEFSEHCLKIISEYGVHIDHEVVHYIAHRMDLADAHPTSPDARGGNEVEHKLYKCGSRAYVTQTAIANALGKSVASVGRSIHLLKQTKIIVNFGKGWYELDCNFFWRGKEEIRQAYRKVQPLHRS